MKPPKEQKPLKLERLTIQQSGSRLWIQALATGGLGLYAIQELISQRWLLGALISVFALMQAIGLPALWRQHHLVKSGAEIFAQAQPTEQVSLVLSIIVTGTLTLLVAIASIGSFFLFRTAIMTLTGMMVFCGVNFFLWLMVAFLWYRCFTPAKAVPAPVHTITQEGVWPPAPLVNKTEGDEVDGT